MPVSQRHCRRLGTAQGLTAGKRHGKNVAFRMTVLEADSPFGSVLDASPASTAAPESEGRAMRCQRRVLCRRLNRC